MPNLNTGLKKSFSFQLLADRTDSLSTTRCRSRALRSGDYAAADGAANREFLTAWNPQNTDFPVQFAGDTLGGVRSGTRSPRAPITLLWRKWAMTGRSLNWFASRTFSFWERWG